MDSCVDAAKARLAKAAVAGNPQAIIVEEIRDAKFSDSFDFGAFIGILREGMAMKVGNDDALTDEMAALIQGNDRGRIATYLDAMAEDLGMRIDGFVVVERSKIDRWWVLDKGDSDV